MIRARDARLGCCGLVLLLGLGGGCAGKTVPTEHFYRLPVGTFAPAVGARKITGVLSVQRFETDALLSQRHIVFAEQGSFHDLKQYHYHMWVDPPPRMLQEVAVQSLRQAGVADEVVTSDVRVTATHQLSAKIKHLEHLRSKPARVLVHLEFSLNRFSDGRLLWVKDFVEQREVADESISSAAEAMGTALRSVLERLADALGGG